MADYDINAVTRRVVYTGSAGTGPYSFTFEVLDQNDLAVYFNSTKLTLTTDYTVSINANGTGSITIVTGTNVPSTPTASDQITILGARDIERTTDFVTAGDLRAAALNEQLDGQIIMTQQIAEEQKRTLAAPPYDPAHVDDGGTLNMTLPAKDARKGKYLAFNATTGNPEAGASSDDVATLAAITDDIATLADIEDGTDATDAIQTVAGISGNVTTVAGISGNVTTVAGISSNVTSVAGNATNINTVAGISGNVTTVAGISSDVTAVAADATDIGTVATDLTGSDTIGTVAGIASDVTTVAGISSDVTAVVADATDIGTVATDLTGSNTIGTVAGIAADVTTVAGISSDVSSVAAQVVGYAFSTTTTMSDPGSGNVRFNNATVSSVTAIAIDDLDSNGVDQSAYIALFDDSTNTVKGTLVFRTGGGDVATFNITGLTDNTGWFQIAVTHVASSGTFSAAEDCYIGFTRAGDKGADGAGSGDVSGPGAAVTDNAVVRWDTTSGQLVQNSTVTVSDVGAVAAGSLTLTTDLAVADGGTGASDAATARTNLGLGTISTQASTNVDIDGGAIDGTTIGAASAAAGTFTTFTSTGIDDNATSTAITIDSSQNIGIGTASPSQRLHIFSSGDTYTRATTTSYTTGFDVGITSSGITQNWNRNNTAWRVGTNNAERMRIESGGKLRIATTAGNADAAVTAYGGSTDSSPALELFKGSTTNTTSQVFMRFEVARDTTPVASGSITANGAAAATFTAWSDRRLKKNIIDLPPQLENICKLKPSEFDFIDYPEGEGHQVGFIAQDMREVYPDVVSEGKNGILQISGWSKTEARLVKAIQEQQEIIKTLEARVALLEAK